MPILLQNKDSNQGSAAVSAALSRAAHICCTKKTSAAAPVQTPRWHMISIQTQLVSASQPKPHLARAILSCRNYRILTKPPMPPSAAAISNAAFYYSRNKSRSFKKDTNTLSRIHLEPKLQILILPLS